MIRISGIKLSRFRLTESTGFNNLFLVRLLVAVDFSKNAEKAVLKAVEFGLLKGSEVYLFHSVPTIEARGMVAYEKIAEEEEILNAQKHLMKIRESIESGCGKVECIVKVGHPGEQILRAAEELNVDLIVMGTRGLTGISRAIMGSIAQFVIANSKIPVLVVPLKG